MKNAEYHAKEKRGSKKRSNQKQGKMPKKARIAEKNKRRAFKAKYEGLSENQEKE